MSWLKVQYNKWLRDGGRESLEEETGNPVV